ncbi:ketopantoate reductase family protein [Pedobacter sp. L105]|uniref:ketopantoate reductase family protein n=1 Tax=Pedobacter sp. L105 TaxID=1641871 RepID=UPI00131DD8CE|nr:2-dehydropantoate 2-reductase [Pedobacter sp. L105]
MTENTHGTAKDIYIIGNGVIAKALAVALVIDGRKVTVIRGSVDQQPVFTENIQLEMEDSTLQADVTISTLSNHEHLDGIIVLTNKSFGNKGLADKLKLKSGNSPIVFLQNGLHVEKSFLDESFPELYRCVLMATCQSITKNSVRFRAVGASPIGIIKGSADALDAIVAALNTAVFSFRAETAIQTVIWKKVIINCVFNSICPLLEIDNGVFHRNTAALQLAETVIKECLAVAHENGIDLTIADVRDNVLLISKMSDGQKISTYQDLLNKRETEIDTLNFAVAKAAGAATVPVTSLLGELIKIKSELSKV